MAETAHDYSKMLTIRYQTILATALVFTYSLGHAFAAEAIKPAAKPDQRKKPESIRWSLLAPENGKPFHDPFAKLTSDQLSDVGYVIRVRRLVVEQKIDPQGIDGREATKRAQRLQDQGIDIGWLMSQRDRVRQIRGLQVHDLSKTIAKSLADRQVTLTGYVAPITIDGGRVTEFFLMPTVAACNHEAAPPRLQVVYVSTKQGFAPPEKSMPVRVTGNIHAETTVRQKVNASGKTTVRSAYRMLNPTIETYAQAAEHQPVARN